MGTDWEQEVVYSLLRTTSLRKQNPSRLEISNLLTFSMAYLRLLQKSWPIDSVEFLGDLLSKVGLLKCVISWTVLPTNHFQQL